MFFLFVRFFGMIFELRLCFFWLTSDHIYIYIFIYIYTYICIFCFFQRHVFPLFFSKKTPGVSPFRWVTGKKGEGALAFDFADIRRVETQRFRF